MKNFSLVILSVFSTLVIIAVFVFVAKAQIADWFLVQGSLVDKEKQEQILIKDQFQVLPEIIKSVNPAVVAVVATKDVPIYERYYEEYDPWGGFFGGGFQVPRVRELGTQEREVGGGSGFFVSADGEMLKERDLSSVIRSKSVGAVVTLTIISKGKEKEVDVTLEVLN